MGWTNQSAGRLIVRQVDEQLVVLDKVDNRIHHLNESASMVWRLWHEGRTPADIANELANEFAVDRKQALCDVQAVLQSMDSLHLLRERRVAATARLAA